MYYHKKEEFTIEATPQEIRELADKMQDHLFRNKNESILVERIIGDDCVLNIVAIKGGK